MTYAASCECDHSVPAGPPVKHDARPASASAKSPLRSELAQRLCSDGKQGQRSPLADGPSTTPSFSTLSPRTAPTMLPDPSQQPLLKPDQVVGLIPGMGRSAIYEALSRGDLPSIRIGSRLFIPTQQLLIRLGLLPGMSPTGPDTHARSSEREPESSGGEGAPGLPSGRLTSILTGEGASRRG